MAAAHTLPADYNYIFDSSHEDYYAELNSCGIITHVKQDGDNVNAVQSDEVESSESNDQTHGERKRTAKVACFKTMPKFFFDTYRLNMYSRLNQMLRTGSLRKLIPFPFTEKRITHNELSFEAPDIWWTDRTSFDLECPFRLKLTSPDGIQIWNGYFAYSFWADGNKLAGCLNEANAHENRADHADAIRMSTFLVPYTNGKQIDDISEEIWKYYYDGIVPSLQARNATDLAHRMGLNIIYLPLHNDDGVGSILFFSQGNVLTRDKEQTAKKLPPTEVTVPANTIVINTNIIKREYSSYDIFHECYHYQVHYLFFVLQQTLSNDLRVLETMEVKTDTSSKQSNPIYWIEWQANRGAYGLMMPASEVRPMLQEALAKVKNPLHNGYLYETAGINLAGDLCQPYFRVKARMLQFGHIHAHGALNYVRGKRIQPFDFSPASLERPNTTFVIDKYSSSKLYEKNPEYRSILDTGRFIYIDGHIVRNSEPYVCRDDDGYHLTPLAYKQLDQCALRFSREYKLKNIGRYKPGRLNYDADYVKQTQFYLNDQQSPIEDAIAEYEESFPKTFKAAFDMLREHNHMTLEDLEEITGISLSKIKRHRDNPDLLTVDFVMYFILLWKLPDFIAELLLDRAYIHLSNTNKRHLVFKHILRVEWMDGIEAANEHLKSRGLPEIKL